MVATLNGGTIMGGKSGAKKGKETVISYINPFLKMEQKP